MVLLEPQIANMHDKRPVIMILINTNVKIWKFVKKNSMKLPSATRTTNYRPLPKYFQEDMS